MIKINTNIVIAKTLYFFAVFIGLSAEIYCWKLATMTGIIFSPIAWRGLMKKVKRAIDVSGRPMPVTPFTNPDIKKIMRKIM